MSHVPTFFASPNAQPPSSKIIAVISNSTSKIFVIFEVTDSTDECVKTVTNHKLHGHWTDTEPIWRWCVGMDLKGDKLTPTSYTKIQEMSTYTWLSGHITPLDSARTLKCILLFHEVLITIYYSELMSLCLMSMYFCTKALLVYVQYM